MARPTARPEGLRRLRSRGPVGQPSLSPEVIRRPSFRSLQSLPQRPPTDPWAQPLEPIFIPKLQIYFADFPYIRCRIGQRLLTLDTCCGYEYGQRRNCTFTTIFKAPWLHTQPPRGAGALPTFDPSLLASRFVGPLVFFQVVKKKRELFWEQPRRSRRSLVLPLKLYPPSGAGILTCFPFAQRATTLLTYSGG